MPAKTRVNDVKPHSSRANRPPGDLDLGWAVASEDGKFLGQSVAHGDVLALCLEDNERRLKSRISKIFGPFAAWPARF
jgi:hypothetical protein